MLFLYLHLFRLKESRNCNSISVEDIWNLRLVRTYFEKKGASDNEYLTTVNLLHPQFVSIVCESLDDAFAESGVNASKLEDAENTEWWNSSDECLGKFLLWI